MWVEVTAQAEPGRTGAVRVEALMRDVSERKKLEGQTRDLYHQLLQAEKLAALGQTISGVAHEAQQPAGDDPDMVGAAGRALGPTRPRVADWKQSSVNPSGRPRSSGIS